MIFWFETIVDLLLSYHKIHFFRGFMGDPRGQLNASENSLELITVPITRNRDGECDPYLIVFLIDSFRSFSHQIYKKWMKWDLTVIGKALNLS